MTRRYRDGTSWLDDDFICLDCGGPAEDHLWIERRLS